MFAGVGKLVGAPLRASGLLVFLALTPACLQQGPRARSIIGPDGTQMLHVSCGRDQGACFALAGQSCPYGYELSALYDPAAKNNYLVRCEHRASARARMLRDLDQAVAPLAPTVVAPPASAPPAPSWPPPPELWPEMNPWSREAASSTFGQTARLPDGQIDIGY